jgi:hypothetical protein
MHNDQFEGHTNLNKGQSKSYQEWHHLTGQYNS